MSSINQAIASQASVILPKWIEDKKGSDPLVDDLIAYIEQNVVHQLVADERALPPLPEMASASDLAYVMQTPEDWDADYRSAWQKLQVEAHNKRQWRKYALELRAALAATPVQAQHSDDAAVGRFSTAMKAKMAASRARGRSGWDDSAQCSVEKLAAMLCQHVEKGDPVDIANFAMMIHERQGTAIDVYEALAVFMNRRSIGAPGQPMAVSDGWKLVPPEPNDAMQAAGAQAIRIDTTAINKIWTGNAVFRAMIAAAPAAPATQGAAKDTERLRWLVETGARISWSMDGEYCAVWLPDERDGTESRPAEGYPLKCYDSWHRAIDAAITADKEDT